MVLPVLADINEMVAQSASALWRLSVTRYHEMIAAGVLMEDDHLELRDFVRRHPGPQDVALLIEVSDLGSDMEKAYLRTSQRGNNHCSLLGC